jgi:hypothetical protein
MTRRRRLGSAGGGESAGLLTSKHLSCCPIFLPPSKKVAKRCRRNVLDLQRGEIIRSREVRKRFGQSLSKDRPLISAIGEELLQKRIHAEQGRDNEHASVEEHFEVRLSLALPPVRWKPIG